ncbi:hypothetical protein ACIBAG_10180 [Streptomyces sp. NPDC051243]|uniref:hypothetical protein n=1 Tax=Streptomyces sp. NPDC051243 TaxID=3365646 RepID=UPI003787A643
MIGAHGVRRTGAGMAATGRTGTGSTDVRPRPPLLQPPRDGRRGPRWWLGWLVPVIAAHRLCGPTRPDRIVDPLVDRVRFWRSALGLVLTVASWLALGLVPAREIPGEFLESFVYGLAALQFLFFVAWVAIAMVPKGRRWRAAVRWRGPLLAIVLTLTAMAVLNRSGLSGWPPTSPAAAAVGLWLLLFGGYGSFLLISGGARTADVNDALPTLVSLLPILPFTLPQLGDPAYDRFPMAVRLLVHLTGPITLLLLARWELRRLRVLHGVRMSDMWRRV